MTVISLASVGTCEYRVGLARTDGESSRFRADQKINRMTDSDSSDPTPDEQHDRDGLIPMNRREVIQAGASVAGLTGLGGTALADNHLGDEEFHLVARMGSVVGTYANEDGVVETQGLLDAIDDWRAGDLDAPALTDVIDHWRSGDPVDGALAPGDRGWVGEAPASIAGTANPTLSLTAGTQYTVEVSNEFDESITFVLADDDGNVLNSFTTTVGDHDTATVTFTATNSLATYYAAEYPQAMRGTIDVGSGVEPPPGVTPGEIGMGAAPSSDATILWDGETATLDDWESTGGGPAEWTDEGDYFEVNYGTGNIQTQEALGDCHLHLEWRAPEDVEGTGQSRANSGLFMMGEYEFQILDTFENPTYADGWAGAYYAQAPPLVSPLRPPGEWQAYDIFWYAPRFDGDGNLTRPAQATLLINGVVVQAHLNIDGPNFGGVSPYEEHPPELPIVLQDHNDLSPPEFRNIWYRELAEDPVEPGDADVQDYDTSSGPMDENPPAVTPNGPATEGQPPSDANVLLDSNGLSGWESVDGGSPGWAEADDGSYIEVVPGEGDIQSQETFGDSQLHLEWKVPEGVTGSGTDRGNSGVLMLGQYQIQILDTDGNPVDPVQWAGAYPDQAGPQVDAVGSQGEWQSLDVVWQGPRFEDGSLSKPPQVTVLLNETLVQSRLVPNGPNPDGTVGSFEPHGMEGPVRLEDGGDPVQFRNVWQRDLLPTTPENLEVVRNQVAGGGDSRVMKLDVAPDGRVFYTTRGDSSGFERYPSEPTDTAEILMYDPDSDEQSTILEKDVHVGKEEGGQGIAVDPDFEDNGWIYWFYSPSNEEIADTQEELEELNNYQQDPSDVTVQPFNRVSRFTVENGSIDPASEVEVLQIPTQRERCCHVGGAMRFDVEGNLVITTGDDTDPFESSGYTPIDEREDRDYYDAQRTSADTSDLRGSILRIVPQDNGSYIVPDGNLFTGNEYAEERDQGTVRPEIYAMGFRNPWTLAVDPETNNYYVGDYGPDSGSWNADRGPPGCTEFARVDEPGFYGWPYFTGENFPYKDYDFATGESGDVFDPDNPTNDSPNNDGLTDLPPARGAAVATPYSWDEMINGAPDWADPYIPDEIPYETDGTSAPETGAPQTGVFYRYQDDFDPERALPEAFDGKHIISALSGWAKTVTYNADGSVDVIEPFPVSFGSMGDMATAPDGSLYVAEPGSLWEVTVEPADGGGDPPDDVDPLEVPYGIDCGGAHTDETVTIDGLEFDPTPEESQAIDIGLGENRALTDDEIYWPDAVQPDPIPNESAGGVLDPVENTEYDTLYQTEHWASDELTYDFVVENGTYEVTIHTAEAFFGGNGNGGGPGTRVYDVIVQGQTVFDDLDILEEYGHDVAVTETVTVEVTDGVLTVEGVSSVENPKFSAIEIRRPEPEAPVGIDAGSTQSPTGAGLVAKDGFPLVPDDSAADGGTLSINGRGGTASVSDEISGTVHDTLYQTESWGDTLGYEFAIENGTYDVTMYFAETALSGADSRVFNVSVQGDTVVENLDLFAEAGGFAAVTRTVEDVEVTDGTLTVATTSPTENSTFSGIDITPAGDPDPVTAPFGYDAGGGLQSGTVTMDGLAFVGYHGAVQPTGNPDASGNGMAVNAAHRPGNAIADTDADSLYQTELYGGDLSFDVAVENGTYDLTLHFAEVVHGSAGSRVFDVAVQGQTVADGFDIYDEVGGNTAYTMTVEDVEVTDGSLSISTTTQQDNTKISGFELRSAGGSGN